MIIFPNYYVINKVPAFCRVVSHLFTRVRVNHGSSEGSEGETFHAVVVCRFVVLITAIVVHLVSGLLSRRTLKIMDGCAKTDNNLSADLSITPPPRVLLERR